MGNKQFNYRLAFWLIASLAITATLVHVVHAFQMQRHGITLRRQAEVAEAAGNAEQAAVLLKRYLLFAPNDTDALLQYGKALEQIPGQPANRGLAAAAYKQVLASAPNRRDVRDRLIDLLIDLGAFADAREQLTILLLANPKDARLEVKLAQCLEAEGELEQALKTYEKAIEHDPSLIDCYTRQAALRFMRFNQPEAADAVMDAAVKANDKNFEAYLARCLYRMGRGQLDTASQDLVMARDLAPSNARVLVTAAELAYQRGRFDEARAAWQAGLKAHPETLNMYLGLATLEIAASRPQEAIACLRLGLEKYPGNTDLLHLLAETYLQQNDFESAEKVVSDVRRVEGSWGVAEYLQARIMLQRGQWGEAIPLLQKTLAPQDLPGPLASRLYVCLAECYERLGDNDRRIQAYQRALAQEPSFVPAYLGLATALLTTGKSEEALKQYRVLTRLPRPPEEIWLLIGRTLLQRNLALPPKKRDWAEVEKVLERASQSERLIVAAAILRTDVLLAQGKTEEAAKALTQACEKAGDKPGLWTALAKLKAGGGDLAGAEQILAEGRKKLGDHSELRLAALDLGLGLDGLEAKTTLLQHEKDIQHFTREEQLRLLAALADLHYRFGNLEEGRRLTRQLANQPLDLPAATLVLELALQSGDDTLQTRLLEELRRLEGDDGTWWRYGEARRQLGQAARGDKKALDQARTLLADLTKRRPHWTRVAVLEAMLCEMTGDADGALKAYLKAFEQGERQVALVYRLMRLLADQGRFGEADEVMAKAQQQVIPRGDFARFAAETALRASQYERAAALARLATPTDARDYRQFIWLGQILARAERRSEAEEAFRRAVELRDNRPEAWEALIGFYAQTDQIELAEAALDTMQTKLNPAQTPLALAWCEEALGRLEQAEKHYLEAQTKQPSDGLTRQRLAAYYVRLCRPIQADPALRGLFDPTLRFPKGTAEEVVAWARRQLALLRADNGGEAGYREALALLEVNGVRSLADLRAAAFVKATHAMDRAEGIRFIEATQKDQPLTADEHFRLAKLYELDNDWGNARERLIFALELDRRNPEYLTYLIGALLQRNRREEARTWLAKLEKLEPESERVKKFQMMVK